MWDQYGQYIYQELQEQTGLFETMIEDLQGMQTSINAIQTRLNTLDNVVTLLSFLAVVGAGLFVYYVFMKWCKR